MTAYEAGMKLLRGKYTAYIPDFAAQARKAGAYHSTPKVGAVIEFYSSSKGRVGHTGIVTACEFKNGLWTVETVEGNSSPGMFTTDGGCVAPLLDSIAVQQNVDFNEVGVIICNDGTDVRPEFREYPFKVEFYEEPHRGVSGTRNACLDHATADYVMFCDADDMFCHVCGLYIIFREIDNGGFDSLISVFMQETRDPKTKEVMYIDHPMDSTFVHGKVHRRQYLIDNNIRWNEELTIHQDSYFNCLAQKIANPERVKYCPTAFYLWKWRDESVCRHDPKYILKTFNNMLDSNTALVNQFLIRGRRSDAQYYATAMIYDSYFTLNKKEWIDQENQEYRHNVEIRFAKYYKDFKQLYQTISEDIKTQIIVGIKNRMFTEGLLMEHITFDDWIKKIEKM